MATKSADKWKRRASRGDQTSPVSSPEEICSSSYLLWEHSLIRKIRRPSILLFAISCLLPTLSRAQRTQNLTPEEREKLIAKRNAIEKELESGAIIDRKVMVPMRDGKRMAADIYRPKDTSKKYPIIFVRTPYNFNFWDVRIGAAGRYAART